MSSIPTPAATPDTTATLKPPSPLLTAAERHYLAHPYTPSTLSSRTRCSSISRLSLNGTEASPPKGPVIAVYGPPPADCPITMDLHASVASVSEYSTTGEFLTAAQTLDPETEGSVVALGEPMDDLVEAVIERLGEIGAVLEVETQEHSSAASMPQLAKETYQLQESKRSKLRNTLRGLKSRCKASSPATSKDGEESCPRASEKSSGVREKCRELRGKCAGKVKWVIHLPGRAVDRHYRWMAGLLEKERKIVVQLAVGGSIILVLLVGAIVIAAMG